MATIEECSDMKAAIIRETVVLQWAQLGVLTRVI